MSATDVALWVAMVVSWITADMTQGLSRRGRIGTRAAVGLVVVLAARWALR